MRIGNFVKLFAVSLSFLFCGSAFSQSLIQKGTINTSAFPTVSMEFYALDTSRTVIRNLTSGQFAIKEDGITRSVNSVSNCGSSSGTRSDLSVVFAIDVSSSMNIGNRMQSAKNAARAGIGVTNSSRDEVAITSFDGYSYLNQDFTNDRNLLYSAIDSLSPQGGTNYDAGFIQQPGGALRVAQGGTKKRVVIFLTDGQGQGNEAQIIQMAQQNSITVYCIAMEMAVPSILQNIASQTGGLAFGNINNQQQIVQLYQMILLQEAGIGTCTVSWTSAAACASSKSLNIQIPSFSISLDTAYNQPSSFRPTLGTNPIVRAFGGVAPPATSTQTVTITASGSTLTVSGVSISNTRFSVSNWGGSAPPFSLNVGQSRTVTIQFTPTDSSEQYADVIFQNSGCITSLVSVYGGFFPTTVATRTLLLTEPNGGEVYSTCDSVHVRWSGIAQTDTVAIEISSNSGQTWQIVKDTVFGTNHFVFKTPSSLVGSQLRVRVSHLKFFRPDSVTVFRNGHYSPIPWAVPHPSSSNNQVLSVIWPSNGGPQFVVWDASTNDTVRTLKLNNGVVAQNAEWRSDANEVITHDAPAVVCFNPSTGAVTRSWSPHPFLRLGQATGGYWGHWVSYHPTNNNIAVVGASDRLGNPWVVILDLSTGDTIKTFDAHDETGGIRYCSYSPDATRIVSCDLAMCFLWNPSNGSIVAQYSHGGYNACFSPSGAQFAIATGNAIYIYTTSSGALIRQIPSLAATSVSWSPDGSTLICCDGSTIQRVNPSTGAVLGSTPTPIPSFYYYARYRPNGSTVLVAGGPGGCRIHQYNPSTLALSSFFEYKKPTYGIITQTEISADASRVATISGTRDGDLRVAVWNSLTKDTVHTFFGIPFDGSSVASLNNNGSLLALYSSPNTEVSIYNVNTGSLLGKTTGLSLYPPAWGTDWSQAQLISVAPGTSNMYVTGRFGSSEEDSSQVRLTSPSGTVVQRYSSAGFRMQGHVQSKDGSKLYIYGLLNGVPTIRSYNASTGASLTTHFSSSSVQRIRFLSVSGDGSQIAFHDANNSAYLINATTGAILQSRTNTTFPHISSLGKFVAVQSDSLVSRLLPSMNRFRAYVGHSSAIFRCVMDTSGNRALTCALDGTARLWKLEREPVQMDTSDQNFSIAAEQLTIKAVDFGSVNLSESKDTSITTSLCNTGTVAVHLDSIYIAGSNANNFAFLSGSQKGVLNPGECRRVELRFNPTAVGSRVAELRVIHACDTSVATLSGNCVTAISTINTLLIDFGKVEISSQKDSSVASTISNSGTATMNVTSCFIDRPDRVQFSIQSGGGAFSLNPGETRAMALRFAPQRVGKTSSSIRYVFNGVGSPATLLLMGEGYALPRISSSVSAINLPFDVCATTFTRDTTIRIRSTGTKQLIIKSFRFFGPDSALFRLVGYSVPDTIAVGSTRDITIRFSPTAVGTASAILRLGSDADNVAGGNLDIQLSGRRDRANFSVNTVLVQMINIPPTTPKDTTIQISNSGSIPMSMQAPVSLGSWSVTSVTPNPIPPGQSANASLHFAGGAFSTIHDTTYSIRDTCSKTIDVRLTAVVQSPKPVLISAASIALNMNACAGSIDTSIVITNGGLAPLSVSDVTLAGLHPDQFSIVSKPKAPIANGSIDSVVVRFAPTSSGIKSATVVISSNAENAPGGKSTIDISASSELVSVLLSQTKIAFNSVAPSTPATKTIRLINNGSLPLRWTLPITRGQFTIQSILPNPTPPRDTSTVLVEFSGGAAGTSFSDTLSIVDTCGLRHDLDLSADVQSNKPIIISPASVRIPPLVCQSQQDTVIDIRNGGLDTLRVTSVQVIGPALTDFSAVGFSPFSIAPLSTGSILIRFTPSQSGVRDASLVLSTNAENRPQDTIALQSRSERLQYTFSATSITFNGIPENISTAQSLSLTNNGTVPVRFTVPVTVGEFSIESINPNPVPAGVTASMSVRLSAQPAGSYNRTLQLRDSCGTSTSVQASAQVLSGAAPLAQVLSSVGLPDLLCIGTRDTSFSVTNNGNADLQVSMMRVTGPAGSEFNILSPTSFSVSPGDSALVTLRYSIATTYGVRPATLEISTNAANASNGIILIPLSVRVEHSSYSFSTPTLDFDTVNVNSSKSLQFTVDNTGSLPLWLSLPQSAGFFSIDSVSPNPIPPQSSGVANATLRGSSSPGDFSRQFDFIDTCGTSHSIILRTVVGRPVRTTLQSIGAEAFAGEIVEIPIELTNQSTLVQSGLSAVDVQLRFNASLLEPIDATPQGQIVNNVHTIDLHLVPQQVLTSGIAILRFRAMLGNDSVTVLSLQNVATKGFPALIDTICGTFKLKGICYANGPRLVSGTGQQQSLSINPNPADSKTMIDIVSFEQGEISLELHDVNGRLIKTLLKSELAPGTKSMYLQTTEFASGPYLLVMRTPTEVVTKTLEVIR